MGFLSNLLGFVPFCSSSNKPRPLAARPSSAGCVMEALENRRLLSDTPAVSIYPYNPRNDGGPINIEARPDEGGFALRRDGDLKEPLTVNWQIVGGSADGTDHTLAASGTAIIPAKKQGIRVPVQALDDDLVEGDETLLVAVASGSGYAVGGPSSAELILGDDDAVPDLSLNGLSEEQEEDPGAILAAGGERMALNLSLQGDVRIGSSAVLSITWGADQIRVWSAQSDGELLLDTVQPSRSWQGQNLPSTLWIEALSPSQTPGDIALTLSFHANPFVAAPATDLVKLTVEPIPVVSIGLISDGSEDADPSYPEDGPKPLRFQISRSANSLYPEDPYPDELKVYLDQPDGTAAQSEDYESLPEYILIPAGQGSAVLSVKPMDDGQIEPHETMIVTLAQDPMGVYGFADPATLPAAEGEIKDNEVLIILVSGRNQNGADDDEDGNTGAGNVSIDDPTTPENEGAGIRRLRDTLIADGFKEGEIHMFSSDGGGTDASRDRVIDFIRDTLQGIIDNTPEGKQPRILPVALAGYSWGGGMIEDVLERVSASINDQTFPSNLDVRATAYIDAVEHGIEENIVAAAESERPVLTDFHYNYYQGSDDDLNGNGVTLGLSEQISGAATADNGSDFEVNLDDSSSHDFWLNGVEPPADDNHFTHYLWNAPGYDNAAMNQNRWGIDGYEPVMKDISGRFKQVFGR